MYCPILKRNVVYLDCLECETKECRNTDVSTNDKEEKENSNIQQNINPSS
jgi:hypothetical protein